MYNSAHSPCGFTHLEDSGMSFSEQSDAHLLVNEISVKSEPSVKLHASGESQEKSSALLEEIPS